MQSFPKYKDIHNKILFVPAFRNIPVTQEESSSLLADSRLDRIAMNALKNHGLA
jgi:hypothetical protein